MLRYRIMKGRNLKEDIMIKNSSRVDFSLPETNGLSRSLRSVAMTKAFTLAEVLITLGIIGVVAAMTLPSLIANYQKKQTVVQLKKAYSEIDQAIRTAQVEHGTLDTWDLSGFSTQQERTKFFTDNYLLPNIKVIKTCDLSNRYDCWPQTTYNIDGEIRNEGNLVNNSKSYYLITASGYSMGYWLHGNGNGGWFIIDINGPKRPNTFGKDIFRFWMNWGTENPSGYGFWPSGMSPVLNLTRDNIKAGDVLGDGYGNCIKNSGKVNSGYACAALIMHDGWEIKDDYPW